ncbi:GNAT family N-acetyltransferase [Dongia sedimenti]|uniref:GNAT family N-acetyltransferase n=1 Tax=Dongia sedimenti TaxID=3064282 RepID=A0ABU0YJY8_9PROT|nr:GNAT family N-acetyltransferase [Rhodospirillaceae bacterium R-7]
MGLTVRPATAADRNAVYGMLGEFMAYLDAIEPADHPTDIEHLLDQAFGADPVCQVLVAESDGQAVGYLSHHPGVWEIFRVLYVVSLFVRSDARNTGARRALMDAAKAIARQKGATRLVWEVWSKNPLAIDFYKAIGGAVFEDNLRMSLAVE